MGTRTAMQLAFDAPERVNNLMLGGIGGKLFDPRPAGSVEAMAQAGAVLMSKSLNADVERKTIFFMSLDACRFRQPVRPGDVLRMKVQVLKARAKLFKFRGEAMIGDKLAAEAEWAAMVVETG